MRLARLDLKRFGPFTETSLEFPRDKGDLQLIYGSNEAGKSSALRAIAGFFYGIPVRTVDAHVHTMPNLRIGAAIEAEDGTCVAYVRRKANTATLLDLEEQPVDEARLNKWLGGVSLGQFRNMFGISHADLVRGGRELLDGNGDLGESLFGGGGGIRSLHQLRVALRAESDAIFKPTASKPPLNAAIKRFKEAKKMASREALKPKEWQDLDRQVREAQDRLEVLAAERTTLLKQRTRLDRLGRVLPQLARRHGLLEKRESHADTPRLPDSAAVDRRSAEQTLEKSKQQAAKLMNKRKDCIARRDALSVPEALLAQAAVEDDLAGELGAIEKAVTDLPNLQGRVAAAEEDARAIILDIGRDVPLARADELRVDVATRGRIRSLVKTRTALDTRLEGAKGDVMTHAQAMEALETRHGELPSARDATRLSRVIAHGRSHGDIEKQLRGIETDILRLEEQSAIAATALGLSADSLVASASLALPSVDGVDACRVEFEALAADRRREHETTESAREKANDIDAELAKLESGGAVPTQEELNQARTNRDQRWGLVRAAWIDAATPGEHGAEDLADEYGRDVEHADDVSDRLRQDAKRAGQHAMLVADRGRIKAKSSHREQALEELAQREEAAENAWSSLWKPAGITPRRPAEMRGWLQKHRAFAEQVEQIAKHRRARDQLAQKISEQRNRCARELVALGEPEPFDDDDAEPLAMLLSRCERLVKTIENESRERELVHTELRKGKQEKQQLQKTLDRCLAEEEAWSEEWREVVEPLALTEHAKTEEAEAVLERLGHLFEQLGDTGELRRRIRHIETDASDFAERVLELAHGCAPDLADKPPQEAAREILLRLRAGKLDERERHSLDERVDRIDEELRSMGVDRDGAEAVLAKLQARAGCDSTTGLEEAERCSDEAREVERKLSELEEHLGTEGLPLQKLVAEAAGVDVDDLPGEAAILERGLTDNEEEEKTLRTQAGTLEQQLRQLDGSAEAAGFAADAQEALAEMRHQAADYARLRLASRILNDEIERYREENQGPILKRAGDMLRRITLESFSRLTTGFDGSGSEIVLLCERATGERIPVEALSDGTRDQLYLALRLASLERFCAANEPLPLVVDDVLINFDERRAKATLELLGEITANTQVLFFTHQDRLREIAREVVPGNMMCEHDLDELTENGEAA